MKGANKGELRVFVPPSAPVFRVKAVGEQTENAERVIDGPINPHQPPSNGSH